MTSRLLNQITIHLATYPNVAARVFHGRGKGFDGLAHLNIEWYPPYLFVQNFGDPLSDTVRHDLLNLFDRTPSIKAILEQTRQWPDITTRILFQRGDVSLPIKQFTPLADDITVEVSLGKNRNTGVFLDMRNGWHWARKNATGKRVLNLFAYTGVFSLFALKGGAEQVDNVDMAANVLKIAQRNHQVNQVHDGRAAFYRRDILKSDRWFENRTPYDLMIVDPPPYQKRAFHGWQDYRTLLTLCRSALARGGRMLMTLNNPQVTLGEFLRDIEHHFPEAISAERIALPEEIVEKDPEKGLKVVVVQF